MKLTLDLGHTLSGAPVIVRHMDNPHLCIDGRSGSGKSYFLKKMIVQAVRQGSACIAFDYSSDFCDFTPPDDIPFSVKPVGCDDFSLNPLLCDRDQSSSFRAQKLLMPLEQTFRMGLRARAALKQATQQYLDAETAQPSLDRLHEFIKNFCVRTTGLDAALEPLDLLRSVIHCGDCPIDLDLTTPGLTVLDFSELPSRSMQHLLIEIILTTIWSLRAHSGFRDQPPLILVLDEAQNLQWGQDSMSIRILREGRKFDVAGWFSSQWMDKPAAVAALHQTAIQAHFRPDSAGINRIVNALYLSHNERAQCRSLLRNLKMGQFLWQNQDGRIAVVCVTP